MANEVRITEETWPLLFNAYLTSSPLPLGTQAAGSASHLPIAATLLLRVDVKRARWFPLWLQRSERDELEDQNRPATSELWNRALAPPFFKQAQMPGQAIQATIDARLNDGRNLPQLSPTGPSVSQTNLQESRRDMAERELGSEQPGRALVVKPQEGSRQKTLLPALPVSAERPTSLHSRILDWHVTAETDNNARSLQTPESPLSLSRFQWGYRPDSLSSCSTDASPLREAPFADDRWFSALSTGMLSGRATSRGPPSEVPSASSSFVFRVKTPRGAYV